MKQRAKIFILSLAVMLTAQSCSLFGGGGPSGEPVKLTWWKVFDEGSQVQPLIAEFQSAFPNVAITYVEKDIETYEDELVDALASGQGPDILTIHNDWLPKHREKLVPAPAKLLSLREFRDSFVSVAADDLIVEDRIYAVPLAMDVLALYYNKDILASAGIARPPATWQDAVNITPKITSQDSLGNFERQAIALGAADNVNRAADILGLVMLQNGSKLYSDDHQQAIFDQTIRDSQSQNYNPGARALEFYTQFANPAKPVYTWNNRSNNSIEAFSAGKVAMILSYAYLRDTLIEKAPFLNYGIAPVPQIQTGSAKVNFANYWAEAVSKQSQHQDVAWQFLKFISSSDVLPKYYESRVQPSSRLEILEQQIADSEIGVFAESALSAKSFYKPDAEAVDKILVQMINDVVLRNVKPEEAVRSATQKVNLLLRNF